MKTLEEKNVLTTTEAAKISGVSLRMVAKWIDKKALKGYRLPLSSARRVLKKDLIEFLIKNKMPIYLKGYDNADNSVSKS